MRSIRENLDKLSADRLRRAALMIQLDVEENTTKHELVEKLTLRLGDDETLLFVMAAPGIAGCRAVKALGKSETASIQQAHADPELEYALMHLHTFGLCYRTRREWVILPEIRSYIDRMTEAEEQMLQAMELHHAYLNGLLNLYGMLPFTKAVEMCRPLFSQDAPAEALINCTICSFDRLDWFWMDTDGREYLVNTDVDEPEEMVRSFGEHPDTCAYAVFGVEEVLHAAEGLPGNAAAYEPVLAWLAAHNLKGMSREELVLAMLLDFFNGDEEAYLTILEALKMEEQQLTPMERGMFQRLFRQVPQWRYHGFSQEEMERMGTGKRRCAQVKARRNDFCPCGSGRKYKNCCGRFQ